MLGDDKVGGSLRVCVLRAGKLSDMDLSTGEPLALESSCCCAAIMSRAPVEPCRFLRACCFRRMQHVLSTSPSVVCQRVLTQQKHALGQRGNDADSMLTHMYVSLEAVDVEDQQTICGVQVA